MCKIIVEKNLHLKNNVDFYYLTFNYYLLILLLMYCLYNMFKKIYILDL